MDCPNCGHKVFRVEKLEADTHGQWVYAEGECINCGEKFILAYELTVIS